MVIKKSGYWIHELISQLYDALQTIPMPINVLLLLGRIP